MTAHWLQILATGLLLVWAWLAPLAAHEAYSRVRLGRVVDGDTVRLDIQLAPRLWLRDQSCRLAGIDTPERGEPGFGEATEALRAMLKGKRLTLEYLATDRYNRWVIRLYADGEDVAKRLKPRYDKRYRRKVKP